VASGLRTVRVYVNGQFGRWPSIKII